MGKGHEELRYLKVHTPKTIDGNVLKTDDAGLAEYKESRLPLTALKHMEAQNEFLPKHLRHKLIIVTPEGVEELLGQSIIETVNTSRSDLEEKMKQLDEQLSRINQLSEQLAEQSKNLVEKERQLDEKAAELTKKEIERDGKKK